MNKNAIWLLALGLGLRVVPARAAVDCRTLPNSVVVTGSTAIKPVLAEIAKVLAVPQSNGSTETGPVTVLYAGAGSCVGIDAAVNGTPVTSATLAYWDGQGAEQACALDSTSGGLNADVAVSDVFASTCLPLPNGLPNNVHDFLGPIQTMTFVVPQASKQDSISAEAAYYVFGFGADSGVAPWTDPAQIFRRSAQSGTQRLLAAAIGVDATLWQGTEASSSSDLRQRLIAAGSNDPESTIGILAADEAQANRATLNVLAYQDFGQACASYPDRELDSNEKENVRSGVYLPWGPMHLLTAVDNNQHPTNHLAETLISYILGNQAPPGGLDLIALEAQRFVVPQCAMRVQRTQEMGPVMPFTPSQPCGCYYEKLANTSTSCKPCESNRDCTADNSICSYHFCETL